MHRSGLTTDCRSVNFNEADPPTAQPLDPLGLVAIW